MIVVLLAVLVITWIFLECARAVIHLPSADKSNCPVKFNIVTGEIRGMKTLYDFHKRHPKALIRSRERAAREGVPVHKLAPMMTIDECFNGIRSGLAAIEKVESETRVARGSI